MIELDTINTSIAFKNVTFDDLMCSVCKQDHKSSDCPSIKQIVDKHIEDCKQDSILRNRSPDRQKIYSSNCQRSFSHSPDRGYNDRPDRNRSEWSYFRDRYDYRENRPQRRHSFSREHGRDYSPYNNRRDRDYSPYNN